MKSKFEDEITEKHIKKLRSGNSERKNVKKAIEQEKNQYL